MAAIEAERLKRLAREGRKGVIVAALTQALATQQPRPADMVDTARHDPHTSVLGFFFGPSQASQEAARRSLARIRARQLDREAPVSADTARADRAP